MTTLLPNFHSDPVPLERLRFFFVFAPNNCGTTVMTQYVGSQTSGYVPPFGNFEGQAAPGVRDIMRNRPWRNDTVFDWLHIRREWEKLSAGSLFVEGSPPNIVRPDQIESVFGGDSTAVISIASPYQYAASCMRRYRATGDQPEMLGPRWLRRARLIRDLRAAYPQFPFLTYDTFTDDPSSLNRLTGLPVREADVRGKQGSGGTGIRNMAAQTTLFLTADELDRITASLASETDLIESLGYQLRAGAELVSEMAEVPGALDTAMARRRAWETAGPQAIGESGERGRDANFGGMDKSGFVLS